MKNGKCERNQRGHEQQRELLDQAVRAAPSTQLVGLGAVARAEAYLSKISSSAGSHGNNAINHLFGQRLGERRVNAGPRSVGLRGSHSMMSMSLKAAKASLAIATALCAVAASNSAHAAQVITNSGAAFTSAGLPISFNGSTFTFYASGDFFAPTAVQTSGGGAFRTVFGQVSTDFPGRGSGIISYGPGMTYAAVPTKTTVSFSNGDNYFGLSATQNGQTYYGYAFTTNNVLNSYGFQTTANTAIVIDTNATAAVPEPASWAMMISGFGMVGGVMRLRRRTQAVVYA